MASDESASAQLWALVPRRAAATAKQHLARRGVLDTATKVVGDDTRVRADFIVPAALRAGAAASGASCAIPTTLSAAEHGHPSVLAFVRRHPEAQPAPRTARATAQGDALVAATRQWLAELPLPAAYSAEWPAPSYVRHGSVLFLSGEALAREPWVSLQGDLREYAGALWSAVCTRMKVTHIVANAPIPLVDENAGETENVMRSPAGLKAVHGDFPSLEAPSTEAFQRALWTSTKQNGVHQVFAPMYSMFSNGNVNEKRRVLTDDLFVQAARKRACTAVDLYAGIGYFAFSYAKAGYQKVLCWEINEWSIEGLCQGARLNGWKAVVVDGERVNGADRRVIESDLLVFHESNEHAVARLESLRDKLPPIAHVNCGYLPSSKSSWSTAARLLDGKVGGWIHAHENCAEYKIPTRGREIEEFFRAEVYAARSDGEKWSISCEHIERVKSYAPSVIHCVFDIHLIPPDLR